MKEYSVWVDETEKIVSFHEVDNSELMLKESQQCFSPMQSMTKRHITKTPKLAYKVSLGAFAIT